MPNWSRPVPVNHHPSHRPELSQEAVRVLWRVLSEGPEAGGLSQQIDDAVRAALCRQHESKLRQQQQQGQHQQGQGQQQQHGQERQRRGSHGGGT